MSRAKRNRNRISYFEPEEPSFDDYVFCSSCGDYVYEYCSVHGPLLVIPDDEVPSPTGLPPLVPRAAFTTPRAFLHLAPSTIPDAGIGVFSTLTLPKGVRFGPYRGLKTGQVTSSYCWQIFDHERKPSHTLDARDPNRSNWMRYVNCSRHCSEQNLLAFQYQGQIYYRTIKVTPRFTELLVFYGSEFANQLNIDLRRYHSSTHTKTLVKRDPKDDKQKTKIPEINLVKCFTTVKYDPKNVQAQILEWFETVKHKSEDDTQETSDKILDKFVQFPIVKENKQNTQVLDEEELITSHEMQLTDSVVEAEEDIVQNLDSMKVVQKLHYESELSSEDKSLKEPTKENIYSNDFEIEDYSNCGQSFDQQSSNISVMQKVVTNINKVKKYSCHICEAAFDTKSEYINHDITVHDSKTNYKACTLCNYKTMSNSKLKEHIERHCNEIHKCDVCGYETPYLLYLERHKRKHSCKYCKIIFKNRHQLRRHLRIHIEGKTYDCSKCKRKFNDQNECITHCKTHTETSTCTCTVCGKEFKRVNGLKRHMTTHSQLRPYMCEICKYGFKAMDSLKRHMKVHLNVKPQNKLVS